MRRSIANVLAAARAGTPITSAPRRARPVRAPPGRAPRPARRGRARARRRAARRRGGRRGRGAGARRRHRRHVRFSQVPLDEKNLASSGRRRRGTRAPEVLPRPGEALVHEDRARGRSGALERLRQRPGIGFGSKVACGRRPPLNLCDPAEAAQARCAKASYRLVRRPPARRVAAAAPESIASRASSRPPARSWACPAAAIAPAALRRIASRRPPSAPAKTANRLRVLVGVPPRSPRPGSAPRRGRAGRSPGRARRRRRLRTRGSPCSTARASPIPPAPCTTNACRAELRKHIRDRARDPARRRRAPARAPAGFVSGPSTLKTVRVSPGRAAPARRGASPDGASARRGS